MNKIYTYNRHYIDKHDINIVKKALLGQHITKGKYLVKFEDSLKRFFKCNYALTIANATIAFDIIVSSLKLDKKKDIVILSANTFCSAANSLKKFGVQPVFSDIKSHEPNLDPALVESEIKRNLKKKKIVRAIIVTDYGGLPADWKSFYNLKKKYGFLLINDNCHALGSKYYGDRGYACKYADIVVQSFHAVKNITTAEGGAILTNNQKFNKIFYTLREHGFIKTNNWTYNIESPGFNGRLSELQCALGYSQLKKINIFLKKRKEISKFYDDNFSKLHYIKLPPKIKHKESSYHLYYLRFNFKRISKDYVINKLKKYNINLQVHYIPTYRFSLYKKKNKISNFINNEKFYKEVFSIPI